jgi:hypothetical protein
VYGLLENMVKVIVIRMERTPERPYRYYILQGAAPPTS